MGVVETDMEQIRAEVRFALNQLRVRNGQHEFETMTRTLARATVSRNLLPATGPVAAGGDQGRDFESFPTQLSGQIRALGRELEVPDKAIVGFACTLQQEDLRTKIRGDVDKIVGEGPPVEFVVAYCEADIPVARRHAIERDVHTKHGIRLAIFDGNAITDILLDHATFWIAETYLHVPARVLPPPSDRPDWYEQDLARWRSDREPLDTMGRLIDVAGCLYYACGTHDGRADVPFWLEKLETALEADRPALLRRRAQYEYVAAHVRGLGSLHAADNHAVEYLTTSLEASDPADLEDATLLLSYTATAFARGETSLDAQALLGFNRALQDRVLTRLAENPTSGQRCQLLDTLATLRLQPDPVAAEAAGTPYRVDAAITSATFEERMEALEAGEIGLLSVPLVDKTGAVDALDQLTRLLPEAPLFPVDTLSRYLTLYTPALIDEPGFDRVVAAVDRRVAQDSGETVAAERALDRSQTLWNMNNRVGALRSLHRARLGLFNGDARTHMLEATLATATTYNELGLHAAGKYFGLVAAELCDRQHPDHVSQGLAYAAIADFHQGNWISATFLACRALLTHRLLDEQALDFEEHPWLSAVCFALTQVESLATKLGAPYADYVDDQIDSIGARTFLDELVREALSSEPGQHGWWEELETDAHVAKVLEDLGRPPFADSTAERSLRFSCLGVIWTVEFRNAYPDVAAGERFAAALQVALGQLAAQDLVLLPTRVTVHVSAAQGRSGASAKNVSSVPEESRLLVALPSVDKRTPSRFNEAAREVLAAVTAAIALPSTLDDDRFQEVLETALNDELLSSVVFGLPYDLAWRSVVSEEQFTSWPHAASELGPRETDPQAAHPELRMPRTPGPGYTREHALSEVQHRYDDLPPRMIPTLGLLRHDPAFAETLTHLRVQGWSDWQLLIAVHNLAKNARLDLTVPATRAEAKAMTKKFMAPEPPGDPMPAELFTAEALLAALRMAVGSSAQNWWQLTLRQEPLGPEAVLALLQARYGWSEVDVEHHDPFAPDAQDEDPDEEPDEEPDEDPDEDQDAAPE